MTFLKSLTAGSRRASQIAFISNLAFLSCIVLRYKMFIHEEVLLSILLVLGWAMGFWINLAVNAWVLTLALTRRLREALIPGWLIWTNAFLLLVEIYYYLFI